MKIAVCGGVVSTERLLRQLKAHRFEDVHVWGYQPRDPGPVSGWVDLSRVADDLGFRFTGFRKAADVADDMIAFGADVFFAVGLSQIIAQPVLDAARYGAIGFHPTALPKGRGRGALAWLILEQIDGAASFFEMRAGVDDGPILAQAPFAVVDGDDVSDLECKVLDAMDVALEQFLPTLTRATLQGVEQDHTQATWFGRRTPLDGWIDWTHPASDVLRLICASAPPHPGARTAAGDVEVILLLADTNARAEIGVPGRILEVFDGEAFTVATGSGVLRITRWVAPDWQPKVGQRLGYQVDAEIHALRNHNQELEQSISDLKDFVQRHLEHSKSGQST